MHQNFIRKLQIMMNLTRKNQNQNHTRIWFTVRENQFFFIQKYKIKIFS